MSVIKLETKDQILYIKKPYPIITSGNINNDYITVKFDDTWQCAKANLYGVFSVEDSDDYYSARLTTNTDGEYQCIIPKEVLGAKGRILIGIREEFESCIKTSNKVKFPIYEGLGFDVEGIMNAEEKLREIERMIDESGVIEYDSSIG